MKAITYIVVLIVAFSLGHISNNRPKETINNNEVSVCEDSSTHRTKTIFKNNNKACSVELEKAKLLYGKAFTLFLANIGIKLSRQNNKKFFFMLESPDKYIEDSKESSSQQATSRKQEIKANHLELNSFLKNNVDFVDAIDDKDLIEKNLDNVFKDPILVFARSKHIKDFGEVEVINGLYTGKLFLFEGKNKNEVHDVEMNVDYTSKEGEDGKKGIDGSFSLKLISEGTPYSNSSGTGGNGDIRAIDDNIIIEAGPNNFFSFKKSDLSTANFYSSGKHIGFLRLSKVSK